MTNLDSVLKSRDITLPTKVHIVKDVLFPVVMYGYESWTIKKAEHWRTDAVVLEKILESSLDSKEIKSINTNGNQPQIFIRRTDAEAEAPILWPPDVKSQLIRKGPDGGKDWKQEDKGVTENEVVGCYHWLSGHEFEQTLRDGEGQGSLVCCSPWGCRESDMTERLNNKCILGCTFKVNLYHGQIHRVRGYFGRCQGQDGGE